MQSKATLLMCLLCRKRCRRVLKPGGDLSNIGNCKKCNGVILIAVRDWHGLAPENKWDAIRLASDAKRRAT